VSGTINDISLLVSSDTNCLNLLHPIQILVSTAASASPSTLNTSPKLQNLSTNSRFYIDTNIYTCAYCTSYWNHAIFTNKLFSSLCTYYPLYHYFLCAHFWQLVQCIELLPVLLSDYLLPFPTTHTTVLLLFWNLSGTTRVSRYQKGKTSKVKTNLDLLEQEIVSGSGICWAICRSPSHPRQPRQHSVFYRPDALPAAQPRASMHCHSPLIITLVLFMFTLMPLFFTLSFHKI